LLLERRVLEKRRHDTSIAWLPHLRAANLLLIGPDDAAREFLAPLIASLPPPIVSCDGVAPELPNHHVGSLIVRDVAWLTWTHQQQLLDWLNGEGRGTRVVATSATDLFPNVTGGLFSADLYYRLNTVTLMLDHRDVSGLTPQPHIDRTAVIAAATLTRQESAKRSVIGRDTPK
jgi:hypothetical protein